ncbi:hypothetical protein RND81_02G198800 [Saponaria officinalis]|uniref:Pentatricopeptide repeat-containing protein n=1 Tax=Saponaria officinalis TaxID=3572 RepID=A0AAW1MW75_SAPOF
MYLHRLLHRRTQGRGQQGPCRLPTPSSFLPPSRTFSFSSAEEAAVERRRRNRRLRIEPPLHALRRDPSAPRLPPDPNAKRLPDTTSALTGPRLNLHNRAVSLFHYFFIQYKIVPNIVSYNFLINTHCDCGRVDEDLKLYQTILSDAPFSPSSVTFRHLTKGLIDAGRIEDAVDKLREMLNKGLGADSLVYNNLIKGFLDLGDLDKANEFFDELKWQCSVYDGVWFFSHERGKEAMESYRSLLDLKYKMTPATCNVLLEVLLRHGKKEAWELFDSMLDNHTTPTFQAVNSESFNIMVKECFKEGKYDEAVSTFRKVGAKMGSRPFVMDVAWYTNMIVKLTEHGMLSEAEKFFSELQTKSLSQDMVDVNLRVIPLYANKWFTELIECNKVVECSQILAKMGDREVKPDSSTYEIVIKGLIGVSAFDVVVDIVSQAMRYSVGVTASLRESLLEVFKEGRKDEIEKVLDERRQGYWQQSRPQPSGPPRQVGAGQFSRACLVI